MVGEFTYLTTSTESTTEIENVTVETTELRTHTNCHYVVLPKEAITDTFLNEQVKISLIENGFLIVRDSLHSTWEECKSIDGFNLISLIKTPDETLLMYQQVKKEVEKFSIHIASGDYDFEWLEPLKETIKKGVSIIVEQNESYSGIMGLANCIRREPGGQNLRCVQIDDITAPMFDLNDAFFTEQLNLDLAMNVLRDGEWGSYRHLMLTPNVEEVPRTGHYFANLIRLGDLSSFEWMTGWLNSSKSQNMVNIQYATINFRDVMLATGRLPPEVHSTNRLYQQCLMGLEYSGKNRRYLNTQKRLFKKKN